jgi:hypothetical protein
MKKFLTLLSLFVCFSANSQDVEANNAIKMGYNFVTVSQTVVFNSAMQAGGTFTLSTQAMDGGGRAPGDPFTIKMVFYNSSNAIVNTAQLSNTLVYGATTPTTYTTTTTNCGGSCANVAYVKVEFYGKDGGYWAGNYGPYIINPSLRFNGGPNILYNPQFGIYGTNGFAQGWTSSNGWQNCQLYSGAQTCVINNNAPVNGGSYSATGGSSSGTAGGYTAQPPAVVVNITTTQQSQVAAARARQTIANQVYVNQVGSYNSVDVLQSGTYHLSDIVVSGDSNIVGLDQLGTKHYSYIGITGSSNTVNTFQSNNAGVGHYSGVTITGNNNTANVSQTGDAEKTSFVLVNGNNNNITNNQVGTGTKYSDIKTTGNGHTVSLDQKDAGSHSARIEVTNSGGSSTVNVLQQGNTNQTYLLQQSCANAGGCSVTMTQQ